MKPPPAPTEGVLPAFPPTVAATGGADEPIYSRRDRVRIQVNRARRHLYLLVPLTVVSVVAGGLLVRNSVAVPATTWMHQYDPGSFESARDLLAFLQQLRVPIPPLIAGLEILSVQHTGTTDLVTTYLYRTALVAAYVLALWFTFPSIARLCAALPTALVFLWATVLVHPLNPQSYDIFLPCFLLLSLICLKVVRGIASQRTRLASALAASSGFFMSMAELTRPFVFLLLPFLVAGGCLILERFPRRVLVAFLLPLVLLTGVWHVHLFARFGQVLASNYSGFNLRRAWPMAPLPEGMWETHSKPAVGEAWPNLNTDAQFQASQALQRVVLRYVVAHPLAALRHAGGRIALFVVPQTSMYGKEAPSGAVLSAYRIIAPAAFLFMVVNTALLAWHAVAARRRFLHVLAAADNLLLLVAFSSLLALSLGEAEEEARLALSLLPFLAAYPIARPIAAHAGG
jgi:hypothetical protein